MLNKYVFLITGIFLISLMGLTSSYTAPSYNSINFTLCSDYTPPSYNSINFTLAESETCGATEPPSDTCTCAGLNQNWEVDLSDECTLSTACDLGTGKLSFTGSGTFTCDAQLETTDLGDVGNGNFFYVNDDCRVIVS